MSTVCCASAHKGSTRPALMQMEHGFYDLAAFSLEQALQLYLKACLISLGADYPRTHSVRRLLKLIWELTGSSEVGRLLEEFTLELAVLEDAYITARYVVREYTREEVEKLLRAVREIVDVLGRAACKGGEEARQDIRKPREAPEDNS